MADLTNLYVQALKGSLDLPLLQDGSESIAATMKAVFQPGADEVMLALSISPEAYRWDHRETAIVNEIMRPLRAQGESSTAGAKREADQTALKVWLVLRMGRVARGMVIAERASRNEEEPISRAKLLEKMLEFADDGSAYHSEGSRHRLHYRS